MHAYSVDDETKQGCEWRKSKQEKEKVRVCLAAETAWLL